MSYYEIKRDETDRRKVKPWIVLKDGMSLKHTAYDVYYRTFDSRKQAQKAIDEDAAYDAYLARLYEQNAAGFREWNAEESKEIDDYAAILKANAESWTFLGKDTAQNIARRQHEKDARDLESDSWIDPKRVHAETRRIMAARAEAFKRAGLVL